MPLGDGSEMGRCGPISGMNNKISGHGQQSVVIHSLGAPFLAAPTLLACSRQLPAHRAGSSPPGLPEGGE